MHQILEISGPQMHFRLLTLILMNKKPQTQIIITERKYVQPLNEPHIEKLGQKNHLILSQASKQFVQLYLFNYILLADVFIASLFHILTEKKPSANCIKLFTEEHKRAKCLLFHEIK